MLDPPSKSRPDVNAMGLTSARRDRDLRESLRGYGQFRDNRGTASKPLSVRESISLICSNICRGSVPIERGPNGERSGRLQTIASRGGRTVLCQFQSPANRAPLGHAITERQKRLGSVSGCDLSALRLGTGLRVRTRSARPTASGGGSRPGSGGCCDRIPLRRP